jgi:hypothetical protein
MILFGRSMPYYGWLVPFLVAAPHRVNAAGEIDLSVAEAFCLRYSDFPTAAPGLWRVPPLPPQLVSHIPHLTRFAENRPQAVAVPEPVTVSPRPASSPSPKIPASPAGTSGLFSAPSRFEVSTVARVRYWLTRHATRDQRRILASVFGSPSPKVTKRHVQQCLHRITAARLNPAIAGLVAEGFLVRDGKWLVLSADVRAILVEAGFRGVNRSGRGRALARGRAQKGQKRRRFVYFTDRAGRLVIKPALKHGRRPVPPVGTSEWGRSQLARRGGLAEQRMYRAAGVHPTAAATQARRDRQQRRRQDTAAPPSPVMTHSVWTQPVNAAESWPGNTTASQSVDQQVRYRRESGDLRTAWRSLTPIGRRERLAAERRRR